MAYNPYAKYGLTQAGYKSILAAQGSACAICHVKTKLCVDHCHKTGKVRGLLCAKCNTGLGMFRDTPERFEAALAYLDQNQGHLDTAEPALVHARDLRKRREVLAKLMDMPEKVRSCKLGQDGVMDVEFWPPGAVPVPSTEPARDQLQGLYQDLSSRAPMTLEQRDAGSFPIPAADLALEIPKGMIEPPPMQYGPEDESN